jgi:hypothetical protein
MCGVVASFLSYLTPKSSMMLPGWMVFPSTSTVTSDTLPACVERSSRVLAAFMLRPILLVYSTKRSAFPASFLTTSSTFFPVCQTLESSA